MKLYQKLIAAFVLLISCVIIFLFKNLPTGKLWNEYSVLYVTSETSDYTVTGILDQNGVKNYVSLNNQYLPLNLNPFSPEISFLQSNYDNPDFSYLAKRNAYFFDKSKNYRLYYIPSDYKNKLGSITSDLNKKNINSGIDSSANYPFVLPLILLLVFVLLIFYSKNKIFFAAASVLPFLFIFCNPFYTISVSIILLLLCLFFISNVWNRKGAFNFLLANYSIPAMFLISVISGFACNWKVGLIFLLCILGTAAEIILFSEAEVFFKNKKSFNYVNIISARRISIFAKKGRLILPVCIGFSSLILVLFFVTSFSNLSSSSKKILIPSQKGSYSEELPQLEDYYNFVWNLKAAPYKSINSDTADFMVTYPRYINENGRIKENFETVVYSEEFKNLSCSEIDNLKFESIEKVLKKQDKDCRTGFVSTSSYNTSLFAIILLLLSYFILLFLYISIIISKGIKK